MSEVPEPDTDNPGRWMLDGCSYDSEWSAWSTGVLGMCACGSPEDAYNFLRLALQGFDRRGVHDKPPTREWINAEAALVEMVKASPETAAHALLHLLDSRDVIEHGGSVGGSWLTALGEALVDAAPAPAEDPPCPPA